MASKGNKELIEKLRTYRLKKKLTQEQLAEKLGVTRLTIIRWFTSQNSPMELQRYQIEQLLRKG